MIKPRWHERQTAEERDAEIAWIRQVLCYDDAQQLAAGVVRAGGACPRCGRTVDTVDVEPLDFEVRDGALLTTSVAAVALPCGHAVVCAR